MSSETLKWLNENTLVGFTDTRGNAWHRREALQGAEDNHYPEAIPAADVIRRLFGWEIKSAPVINGATFDVAPGYQLIYHGETGHPFGVFSDGYRIHQYPEWLIDNVCDLLDVSGGMLGIGSAGLLMAGAVAWVQIQRPDNVLIGGDALRPFICATTSANGKFATSYKSGIDRVICDNTLAQFHRNASGFSVKHSRRSVGRLDEARQMLDITFQHEAAELEAIDQLMNTAVTDAQFEKIVAQLDPVPADTGRSRTMAENKVDELRRLWTVDSRVSPFRNTAWGVAQTYNTYDQHLSIVRGSTRPERAMLNFLNGKTETADRKVVEVTLNLVGAAVG